MRARPGATDSAKPPKWPIICFLVALGIPWVIPIASMHLSLYRIVLIIITVPAFLAWAQKKCGPIRLVDFTVIFYALWCTLSLIVNQGMSAAVETSGILVVESLGAYLLGRVYIRDIEDFERFVRFAAIGVLILMPFAIVEAVTSKKLLLTIFGTVFPTVESTIIPRSGFWRVQGPFDHPIIFGLNCVSIFALAYMLKFKSEMNKALMMGGITLTVVLSFSSAPIAALTIQIGLLLWNWVMRRNKLRWHILLGFLFFGYLLVEFGSNQTPMGFYISHFTFDKQTGWYRLAIWDAGSETVKAHPIFGIGLGEWARPSWMHSDSVDNFWLLTAMRHGLPALILLWMTMLGIAIGLVSNKNLDEDQCRFRMAFLMSMIAYLFVGSTVHIWNAAYSILFFLLGSSVWMIDAKGAGGEGDVVDEPLPSRRRHESPRVRGVRQARPDRAAAGRVRRA